jgi:hypothetical protein
MHNQHKILRVLQLISLLKAKPAKSLTYLSGVLGSTELTVYRYLELLTMVTLAGISRAFVILCTRKLTLFFVQYSCQRYWASVHFA